MDRTTGRLVQVLALMLAAVHAVAQGTDDLPSRPPLLLGLTAHTGFIIQHSQELVDVSNSHPFGMELDLEWLLTEERHTRMNGMVTGYGIALHFINFNDPQLLGHLVGLTPFVEPMIRAQDRLHGAVRLGAGLAFLSRPYDPETNPRNLFYSSSVSFTAMVNAYLGYWATPQWEIRAGFNFNHCSNAGMREPNKGINYPTWSLGAMHAFAPCDVRRPVRDGGWRQQRRMFTYAVASGSIKKAQADDHVQDPMPCWILGAMGLVSWRSGRLTALSAGTEWVHDGYAREMLDRSGSTASAWKGAMMFGPEMVSGRVRLGLLFGAYIQSPSWPGDPVYQRYQIIYTVGKGLLLGTSLKAHRHVADVIDLRLGWMW